MLASLSSRTGRCWSHPRPRPVDLADPAAAGAVAGVALAVELVRRASCPRELALEQAMKRGNKFLLDMQAGLHVTLYVSPLTRTTSNAFEL